MINAGVTYLFLDRVSLFLVERLVVLVKTCFSMAADQENEDYHFQNIY